MAKIRTVKPELWTDEDFIELSLMARLMFIASLNFADDYGVLQDKPRTLAARCLPADSIDAVAVVDELVEARFYTRRESPDGSKVLVIRTFGQHQKIDKRTKGRWGDPSEWDNPTNPADEPPAPPHPAESHPIPTDPAESPHIPPNSSHGREGKGREVEGKGVEIHPIERDDPTEPVDNWSDDWKQRRSQIITAEANARADAQEPDSIRSRGPYVMEVTRNLTRDFGEALDSMLQKHPYAPNDAIRDRVIHEDMTVKLSEYQPTNNETSAA
jgi:hypothetical protein